MAEKKTKEFDANLIFDADVQCVTFTATGTSTLGTIVFGTTAVTAATDTSSTGKWTGAAAPSLTVGNAFITFNCGASSYRIPCWPNA